MKKLKKQKEDYKNIIEKIDRKMYLYISYEEQKKAEMENDKEQGIKIKEAIARKK